MTYFRFAAVLAAVAGASSVSMAQVRTECGEPGTIAHLPGSVSESLEVRAHETCPVPGADILNRSAQGALVVHNYNATTTAPAVQVDQVGRGTALILKRAANPSRAPEFGAAWVSDAAYMAMTAAAGNGYPARTLTWLDRLGNIRFEAPGDRMRAEIRSVQALRLIAAPQVEIETALKLVPRPADAPVVDGALAVVNGTLRFGAGGVWREVQVK